MHGETPDIDGDWVTMKLVALMAGPATVVTVRGPVVAPPGTSTRIWPDVSLLILVAAIPLNCTVALLRLAPEIVTLVPTHAAAGLKLAIVGGWTTVNPTGLVAVPPAVVTETVPLVVPLGTATTILVAVSLLMVVAAVPLNKTLVSAPRPDPSIVTILPATTDVGDKPVIDGVGSTVKLTVLVVTPPGSVIVIAPLAAPTGTTTDTRVSVFESI